MLDSMTVYFHDKVVFVFKDGSKLVIVLVKSFYTDKIPIPLK